MCDWWFLKSLVITRSFLPQIKQNWSFCQQKGVKSWDFEYTPFCWRAGPVWKEPCNPYAWSAAADHIHTRSLQVHLPPLSPALVCYQSSAPHRRQRTGRCESSVYWPPAVMSTTCDHGPRRCDKLGGSQGKRCIHMSMRASAGVYTGTDVCIDKQGDRQMDR